MPLFTRFPDPAAQSTISVHPTNQEDPMTDVAVPNEPDPEKLGRSPGYSAIVSPEPIGSGKSLNLGRPSFMGSTVDS